MIGTDDRTFEKTPDILHGVSVNVTTGIFFDVVVNCLVSGIMVHNTAVREPFVGVNGFRFIGHSVIDEPVKCALASVGDNLEDNLPIPLYSTNDYGFVPLVAMSEAFCFATNESLVHFYDAFEGDGICLMHSLSDAVTQIPGCLVRDAYGTLKLVSRDTLLGLYNEHHGDEPLTEWEMGVMEDSPGQNGELIAA